LKNGRIDIKEVKLTDEYRNDIEKFYIQEGDFFGSSDFGVINKILKKQYDMPINHLADYKIITTFSFL